MKKKLMGVIIICALVLSTVITIAAHTDEQEYTADALNSLGLFLGTDKGYELEKSLTRAEGATLIVRMYGKVDEATKNADKYDIPFTDLVGWERGYVGYAYENNITKGISATEFAPTSELTDYMFLTFTLRALGYNDLGEDAQFVWNNPYKFAKEVGIVDIAKPEVEFTRADAVSIFWNALEAELVGKDMTLAESLIEQGVFTVEDYAKAIDISDDGKVKETIITEPADTSTKPEDTSTKPEDTSTKPEDTSAKPEDTSAKPEDTSAKPEDTTTESVDTNIEPEDPFGGWGPEEGETERDES